MKCRVSSRKLKNTIIAAARPSTNALDDKEREAKMALARNFLESTHEEFFAKVEKAKKRLTEDEPGVLAGPVARQR